MRMLLEVLGALLVTAVVLVSLVAWWAVRLVRRTARAVRRRVAPVQRHAPHGATTGLSTYDLPPRLGLAMLRLRALRPGDEVSRLRGDLRADVTGTLAMLGAAARAGRPVSSLSAIAGRLSGHARQLDVELALVGAEPDRSLQGDQLADVAGRAAELRAACAQVRAGVLAAGGASRTPLAGLAEEIEHEVTGLRLRARAYQELAGL